MKRSRASEGQEAVVREPAEGGSRRWARWLAGVMLCAIAPYILSLRGGFVLDDWGLIVDDPLAHSLSYIPQTFLTDFLRGILGPNIDYYRPLVTVSYQANYSLSGADPVAFRITNLLMNAAVAALVFVLARRLTRSTAAAGIAGMIFAVIPSHAEPVAWISGRTDVLATLFVVGGLITFARSCRDDARFNWRMGAATALLFLCALFSKENALVFPILAAVYAWVFIGRLPREHVLKWIAVLTPPLVVYMVLRHSAVGPTLDDRFLLMLKERMMGVGIAYAAYLRMMFLPQAVRVSYDVFPIGARYPAIALASWLAPVGLVWLSVWSRKRLPVVSFGAMWMFVTLLPVANILPTSGPLPAERFSYMPSVGSSVILGWLAWKAYLYRPRRVMVWPVAVATLIGWFVLYSAVLSMVGAQVYQSDLSWARAVSATNGRFFRGWAGLILAREGYPEEAVKEYEAAIRHDPNDLSNHVELAGVKRALGKPDDALEVLLAAGERFGESASIDYNLGIAFAELGEMEQAAQAFARATQIKPDFSLAWRKLGRANLRLGRFEEAVSAYKQAFSLAKPALRDHLEIGQAYKGAGMLDKAVREFGYVASRDPEGEMGKQAEAELREMGRQRLAPD